MEIQSSITHGPALDLRLTPQGHLLVDGDQTAPSPAKDLTDAFAQGSGHGLLYLGANKIDQPLPPVFAWWRAFASRYVTALCLHSTDLSETVSLPGIVAPDENDTNGLII